MKKLTLLLTLSFFLIASLAFFEDALAQEIYIDSRATISSLDSNLGTVLLKYNKPCGGSFFKAYYEIESLGEHANDYKVLITLLIKNNLNLPCIGSKSTDLSLEIPSLPNGANLIKAEILEIR
jgi:hypothetical protein